MANIILRQGGFFYKSNWTPEVDSMLLSTIIELKKTSKWEGTVIPIPILKETAAAIASEFGVTFPWTDLYERFQLFEQRYTDFKLVVGTRGVFWDVNLNTVTAPEHVWKELFPINTLTGAYYYTGEIEFNRLTTLFGPKTVKVEKATEVVILSDTIVPVEELNVYPYCKRMAEENAGEASESVSSPLVCGGNKLRRKLFTEDGPDVDTESTNEPPKPRNHRPPKAMKKPVQPSFSPLGSSCASSSSLNGWWRNAFR